MIRFLATCVVALCANAIALLVASSVLDDMTVDAGGFITAIVIFSVALLVSEALLRQAAVRNAPALLGSSALVATLVSLIVAELVADGLKISGFTTWVLATVIVWIVSLAARALLPLIIFKKALARRNAPA